MKLSVIIPVYNGADVLGCVLQAAAASARRPDEIIVVDNGSTDRSREVAQEYGACVIQTDGLRRGPSYARNRGAEVATGDVLVFVDADVAVHAEALGLIEQTLIAHPEIAAVFGSYDADPPGSGLASQYKNLLHHYVHQHGHREASTFWTGCGAIRRAAFLAVGGFDEHYTRPSIEDIDLGARLRHAGQRVWLCPKIQATHLKRWTLRKLLQSDIHDRATPWTRLILREAHLPGDLNLELRSRVSAVLAWLVIIGLALVFWSPWLLPASVLAAVSLAALNAGLYRFFIRHGGAGFGIGAIGLHIFYLLYSSLIFGLLAAQHFVRKRPAHRWALWLLLLVTFLKGWLWSAAVLPWQASYEDQHFGYAQEVARQQTWLIDPPQAVPLERSVSWQLSDPFRLSDQREPLDLSPAGRQQIDQLLHQLDDPATHTTFTPTTRFAGFVRQHPPLYYTLEAFVQQLGAPENILTRLAGMRLLSVAIAVATVACAYGAARALWPEHVWLPLAVATLVSFQPLFTFFTAVVTNTALEILCYAALTWSAVVIARRGMNWRRGITLGGILAAGLLTKSSFLPALLLVAVLLAWDIRHMRSRAQLAGWLAAIGLPVALAGWWYVVYLTSGGGELIDVFVASPAPAQSISLVSYLLHYPWLTRYWQFLNEWWGVFGIRDTALPQPIFTFLRILTLTALLGWAWRGVRGWRTRRPLTNPTALTLALGMILTLGLIAFYTALDFQLAQVGRAFRIQGRYFLSPLVAQMLLLAIGWTALRRGRRWVLLVLCLGMIALNIYALAGIMIPRYYGEQIDMRFEPSGQTVTLRSGASLTRDFILETDQLSRLDVWLKPVADVPNQQALLVVSDGEREIAAIPIGRSQMTAPYPTLLRLPDRALSDQRLIVTLRGAGVEAHLAADERLALKTYHAVPIDQWLERMTIVQPGFYSATFFRALAGAYVLSLIALIALLWRVARGTDQPTAVISSDLLRPSSRVAAAPDRSSAGT